MPILGVVASSLAKQTAARWSWLVDEPAANMEYYASVAVFSDGSWAAGGADTSGNNRWIINKWNTNGTLAWQRAISTSETSRTYDIAWSMDTDASDNLFVYGAVKDQNSGTAMGSAMVVKYNSSGTLQWQRRFRNSSVLDIYVNRNFVKKDAGDCWFTGFNNANGGEAFVCSYDGSGTFFTQYAIRGDQPRGSTIWRDSAYNTYVGGYRYISPYDGWVAKFNSSGSLQWARTINISGNTGYFDVVDVVTDSGGNVYAFCWPGNGTPAKSSTLIKFNSSGTVQWQRELSRGTYLRGLSMTIDGSNNLYCVMYSGNTGWQYVAKYNSSGTLQWQRVMPLLGNVYGYQTKADANNLYIASNQYLSNSNATVSKTLLSGTGVGQSVTVNGYTATYAAGDMVDAAGSCTVTNWSPTIGTPAGTSNTPTITEVTTSYASGTATIRV
jgi:hypothetical protein